MSVLQSRLLAYAVLSTGLASAVVLNAYNARGSFYAAGVAVGRSGGGVIVSGLSMTTSSWILGQGQTWEENPQFGAFSLHPMGLLYS